MQNVASSRFSDNLVYLSFQALAHISTINLKKKLRITYDGEVGIDSGGITKDWFLEMSRALVDPRYVLFQKNEHNNTYFVDPRSGVNDQHLSTLNFLEDFWEKLSMIDIY